MKGLGISVVPFGYDPYEDTLKHYHADTTGHSGRTFLEHLKGTRQLLKDWGMPEHVQIGGLYHSIYGTNIFTVQSAPFEDREVLEMLIGKKAERLAFLFCVAERPKAFFDAVYSHHLKNRHDGSMIEITEEERCDLIAIEVANHIEQNMGASLIAEVWDKPKHTTLMTAKAMTAMRVFMHKHGIQR